MGKLRKGVSVVRRTVVGTDSPLAKSAFFKRKEYDVNWQAVVKSAKKDISRKATSWKTENKACQDLTNVASKLNVTVPKYKPRVSKEEMEEMGCEPLGILARDSTNKSRDAENRQLSFSFGTLLNEKTPKRGTPLTQRCVVEMGRNKNQELEELEETVSKIKKSVKKGSVSVEDALIDIEGLKLRRQSASSAKFLHLEMQLRKQNGDALEACIACVRAAFAARDTKSKARLVKELNDLLKLVEMSGDPDAEADIVSESEDEVPEPEESVREASVASSTSPPKSTYTPENVDMTPNIRTGSAAKTRLRFTPLLSSCQRRSKDTASSKKRRGSFKLTPLRRSTRVAAAQVSERNNLSIYRAVEI